MKEIENGIDFEMSELKRKEFQAIKNKCTTTYEGGGKFVNTLILTESERKIYWSHFKGVKCTIDEDRITLKNGLEMSKERKRITNEYNYLNGKI